MTKVGEQWWDDYSKSNVLHTDNINLRLQSHTPTQIPVLLRTHDFFVPFTYEQYCRNSKRKKIKATLQQH